MKKNNKGKKSIANQAKQKSANADKKGGDQKQELQGGRKTALIVILVIAVLAAGGSTFYSLYMTGAPTPLPQKASESTVAEEKETGPTAKPSAPPSMPSARENQGVKPGENKPAPAPPPVAKAQTAPEAGTPAPAAAPKAAPAPDKKPATQTKTNEKAVPMPASAARNPIVVSTPPVKEKSAEVASAKTETKPTATKNNNSYRKPVVAAKPEPRKPTPLVPSNQQKPVVVNKPASYNPSKPAVAKQKKTSGNTASRKTNIDISDDNFNRKTTMDDFYDWPGGQSYGDSKTFLDDSARGAHGASGGDVFMSEKTFYMVLIDEAATPEPLRKKAAQLKLASPSPEIKQTISFGREVYWLTVGHYTTEAKAFNKAQEIHELGFPTTIVSEKVKY